MHARAKLAEDKALAENAVLRREAAALREQLAKDAPCARPAGRSAPPALRQRLHRSSPPPEAPAADSTQTDETN